MLFQLKMNFDMILTEQKYFQNLIEIKNFN